jgi:hypothetical protein
MHRLVLARSGVVGHFIGGKAGLGGEVLGDLEHFGRDIVFRRDEIAAVALFLKRRARLDGELVEREMAGAKANGALKLRRPSLSGLCPSRA